MRTNNRFNWILALLIFILSISNATTYYVNATTGNNTNNGTSTGTAFKTITKALSVAVDADVINVAAGKYKIGETFPLDMVSGVTLTGTAGALATIIQPNILSRVFNCISNSASTIIQGFTITGGYVRDTTSGGTVSQGAGIFIDGGAPIIQNNIITGNTSRGYDFYQAGLGANNGGTAHGGGIYIANSGAPTIQNNVISNNTAQGGGGKDYRGGWSGNGSAGGNAAGGGIYATGSEIIINNTFYGNQAIGGLGGSSNSLGAGDGGNATAGGISASFNAIIKNNIFSNNSAIAGTVGGGSGGSNGTATDGALSYFQGVNFSYNLYHNNTAATNANGGNLGSNNIIGSDPLFVSDTNFHLQALSPARKAGTVTGAPATDIEGVTRTNPPSIGAYDGSGVSSIVIDNIVAPKEFELSQNYPNPFNPATNIEFSVPVNGLASLKIFNAIGQEVATLFDGIAEAGKYHQVTFNAKNLSSGIYFARLISNGKSQMKKLLFVK